MRPVTSGPVVRQVPLAGSYSSVLTSAVTPNPPATRTRPFSIRVAVCARRAVLSEGAGVHKPVVGSYNSALARRPLPFSPPATNTLPLGNSVAVCRSRAVVSDAVAAHTAEAGSYNSELARGPLLFWPPTTSTLP